MASPTLKPISLSIPAGSLGVSIKQLGEEGQCVVTGVSDASITPLEVGDVIVSLNGIKLTEVQWTGVQAWVQLFKMFTERRLVVLRGSGGGSSATTSAGKPMAKIPAAGIAGALKGSTKHNEVRNKRQKVSVAGKPVKPAAIEVISLLDDSDDEDGGTLATVRKGGASAANNGDADPDLVEVSASVASSKWKQSTTTNDSEEELEIVGTKGDNALADFPHSRENCVTHPFAALDKTKHCANCYCYVCDIPADDCKQWASHCNASHQDPRWREEREHAKRQAQEVASAPAPSNAARATSATHQVTTSRPFSLPPASSTAGSSARRPEFSASKVLEKVTTVRPVEMAPPARSGFATSLRHYQKQSVAFMANTERESGRGGFLCDEVGMGKSAVVLALVATNPAKAQSLFTKNQIEATFATIAANDRKREEIYAAARPEIDRIAEMQEDCEYDSKQWLDLEIKYDEEVQARNDRLSSEMLPVGKILVKPTVILTSASLLGQWEDECTKHAPGLVVKTFHGSRKKSSRLVLDRQSISSLNEIDVIISTSTFRWPEEVTNCVEFHRVVQDESHLFLKGPSTRIDCANVIKSPRRWCVSATPMTSSVSELSRQLYFVNGSKRLPSGPFQSLDSAITGFQCQPSESTFNQLVDLLKNCMVRHTKSQRINGSSALSLPPSTTSTVMLTMSADEHLAFNCISGTAATARKHCMNGVTKFAAEGLFLHQMPRALRQGQPRALMEIISSHKGKIRSHYKPERLTKVVALREDLANLRRGEPRLRAVVFTQYVDAHAACVRGLQQDGFEVYQFTGASSANKRDAAIRSFQNTTSSRPAVFVITLKSGNVGITLTAASRVYLLEPSLDPAVEVQAAGRIHRLGQDKPCHVVRFAFKNSCESNIIKLHKEITAGRIAIVDGFVPPEAMRILAEGLPIRSANS